MAKRARVLYCEKGCELFIEIEGVEERVAFVAPNKMGFVGYTLKELIDNSLAAVQAARQLQGIEDELKDIVATKAPALLGITDFVSSSALQEEANRKKEDKVLRDLKPYIPEDAI